MRKKREEERKKLRKKRKKREEEKEEVWLRQFRFVPAIIIIRFHPHRKGKED